MSGDGTGKVKFIYPNGFEVRPEKALLLMGFCPKSLRPSAVVIMAREAGAELEAKNQPRNGQSSELAHMPLDSLIFTLLGLLNPGCWPSRSASPGHSPTPTRVLNCHTPHVARHVLATHKLPERLSPPVEFR